MTVSELRDLLTDYPDDMDVVLLDLNDDSEETGGAYALESTQLEVNEVNHREKEEDFVMDTLCITFKNRHLDSLAD